jgi:hypothetical protein
MIGTHHCWPRRSIARLLALLAVVLSVAPLSSAPVAAAQEEEAQEQPPAVPAIEPEAWWHWDNTPGFAETFARGFIYGHFWDVRMHALRNPGAEGEQLIRQVMDGPPLESELRTMRRWAADHQAQQVRVELSFSIPYATEDDFVVIEEYTDRSYMVDTRTETPLGDGENTEAHTMRMAFRLRTLDDPESPDTPRWKVVDSVRLAEAGDSGPRGPRNAR